MVCSLICRCLSVKLCSILPEQIATFIPTTSVVSITGLSGLVTGQDGDNCGFKSPVDSLIGRFNFWRMKPTQSGGCYWEVSVVYVPHFYWKYKYVSMCSIATCQIRAKEICLL